MHSRLPLMLALGLIAVLGVPSRLTAEIEAAVSNLKYPVFSGSVLTHRVVAKRGFVGHGLPRLEEVEILFIDSSNPSKVALRVWMKTAFYDREAGKIFGAEEVHLDADEITADGVGFEVDLHTSVLEIKHAFTAHHSRADVSSDRAVLVLRDEKHPVATLAGDGADSRLERILRFEALGKVRLISKGADRRWFDEACTDLLIYDGVTGNLTSPGRVRAVKNGEESSTDHLTYPLRQALFEGKQRR